MLEWADLVVAIGLLLVVDGLLYALAPGLAKRIAEYARAAPVDSLRISGLLAVGLGVLIVWLARV